MYPRRVLLSLWLCLGACTSAEVAVQQLSLARGIVERAQAESDKLSEARMESPARNTYWAGPKGWASLPPPFNITPEIARAATIVSDAEGILASEFANATSVRKRAGGFWMETLARKGTVPWGNDPTYKVFRNVVDYGADPTGQKDSTDAINNAITDQKRCGEKCNGSTTKNAIVYFPSGTYKVSRPLVVVFGTQMIGDATAWPLIQASSNFIGDGVMETDKYIGGSKPGPDGLSAQYYVNTANFYRQIRNFKIDITGASNRRTMSCVHYQVAQATSIWNMELIASRGGKQRGMFAENGSGGVMSDITFRGGRYGFYGGNQQFSTMRMRFEDCDTAASVLWDWGWVWKTTTVKNCDEGFRLVSPESGDTGVVGSVSFVDSSFTGTKKAIIIGKPSNDPGTNTTGIVLDNTVIDGIIEDVTGKQYLGPGSYKSWVFGPTYNGDGKRSFATGQTLEYARQSSLQGESLNGLPLKPYFERQRPQYTDRGAGDFVHIKDYAKGDGSTDDTTGVQNAFNAVADGKKILFVDAGTYLIGDTVVIPKDAKIVGETWAQFAAFGPKFSDPKSPRVMLKVGNAKDIGTVEMQDLILTTKGATAGAILMQWNVQAKTQGSAALWDVHVRIGGASGTGLTEKECPSSQRDPTSQCQAASLMLHLTKDASGYFENMWLWTADHNIDDADLNDAYNIMPFTSVYVARGFLIESTSATWLYGTSSEHASLYQYNFAGAQNIYTTMIQTESPYYQPTPGPPAPWKDTLGLKGVFETDPGFDCAKDGDFSGCDESWAVILQKSQNIHIGGAGTYSWFSYYTQDCIDLHACQKALWYVKDNYDNVRVQHIIGIGAKYVLVSEGKGILATDNLAVKSHPAWSQISIFDAPSKGKAPNSVNVCDKNDNTYDENDKPNREGEIREPLVESFPATATFINVVNLTPYRFKFRKDLSNQCQITGDFGDVPAGHSRQMRAEYGTKGSNRVDDNADYYFDVVGTNHRFRIKSTQNDRTGTSRYRTIWDMNEWGLGYKEFQHPAAEVAVNLIVTGSEEYGYHTSMDWASSPQGWMRALYPVIKDRQLRHVVMPGSHDAGMGVWTHSWTGVPHNTKTQGLTIYEQLVAGVRYFDLRVAEVKDSDTQYLAVHVDNERALYAIGGGGESVKDIIDGINRFYEETPGEVIVLWVRYLHRFSHPLATSKARRTTPALVATQADARLMEIWFEKFKLIENRCKGWSQSPTMDKRKMSEFMDSNDGKGCALIIFDPHAAQTIEEDAPKLLPAEGIYDPFYMPRQDQWSETNNITFLKEDQINQWRNGTGARKKDPTETDLQADAHDKFLISQWLLSQTSDDLAMLTSLETTALHNVNQLLYVFGVNAMTPELYPSVIMFDYVGAMYPGNSGSWDVRDPSLRTLAIGLNLYMASQNCYVSNVKFPLLGRRVAQNARFMLPTSAADRPKQWNGVIFANGTRYEEPPPNFNPMYASLQSGTGFRNGSGGQLHGTPLGAMPMDC